MTQPIARADARANRARVLAAAVALFAERGVDAEMREVAERAGVAVGTVYNHFPGKDELVLAVLDEARGEFDHGLDSAEAEPGPVAAIHAFLRAALAVVDRYGELFATLQEGRGPAVRDQAAERARRAAIQERVAGLVRRGIVAGAFRPDLDPYIGGAVLRSVLTPWTFNELRRTRTPDEIIDALMAVFIHGAGRRPNPQPL